MTSAVAGAAGAGVSLTQRGVSSVVVLATGTEAEDGESPGSGTIWNALGDIGGTLVFYMAVKQLANITAELIRAGRPPEEPALVIQEAHTAREKIVVGTLADIAAKSHAAAIQPPPCSFVARSFCRELYLSLVLHPVRLWITSTTICRQPSSSSPLDRNLHRRCGDHGQQCGSQPRHHGRQRLNRHRPCPGDGIVQR